MPFDSSRARLKGADYFPRLLLDDAKRTRLADAPLRDDDFVQIVRHAAGTLCFATRELAWHHVACGVLDGEPFAVTLCIVCHMGVRFSPVVDGRALSLSAGGLYNGMLILTDDETGTYWHHLTGEALTGPLAGARMESSDAPLMSKAEALARDPDCEVAMSRAFLPSTLGGPMSRHAVRGRMMMPPHFCSTLTARDERLDSMRNGLGVFDAGGATFFPLARRAPVPQQAELGSRRIEISRGPAGTPLASFVDGGAPRQLFGRWYGFSFSFPGCAIGPEV